MGRPTTLSIAIGSKQGHLTILRQIVHAKGSHRLFECLCDCGRLVVVRAAHLKMSRLHCSRQCSFLSRRRVGDLTGRKFGRWTALEFMGIANNRSLWRCRCQCGTERNLSGPHLSIGQAPESCGCIAIEKRHTPEQRLAAKRANARRCNHKNPARIKANKIKYELQRAAATPRWLTAEDWTAMNALYYRARELTKTTGIRYEVDHVVPIAGSNVAGLHVPWNLQILTQAQNVSKSNRYADLSGD